MLIGEAAQANASPTAPHNLPASHIVLADREVEPVTQAWQNEGGKKDKENPSPIRSSNESCKETPPQPCHVRYKWVWKPLLFLAILGTIVLLLTIYQVRCIASL